MRLFIYFVKSLNILNLLLIAAVASLAVYLLFPLLNMKVTYRPPAVRQQTPAVQEESSPPNQSPPISDYMVVAEQNVFHPDRKIPPEGKDEKSLPKPEIYLYGTLLTDNMRLAYIEDKKSPQSTPGRGKRQTVVKQGDVVSGFVLKSVEADRIILVRGEEQMIVYLNDTKKQREVVTTSPSAGQRGPTPGPAPYPTPGPPGGSPAGVPAPMAMPATPQPGTGPAATPSLPTRQPSRPPRTNPVTGPGAVQPRQ